MGAMEQTRELEDGAPAATQVLLAETSYKTSRLGAREALVKSMMGEFIASLPGVRESVVLSTCNRFEVYFATTSPEATYSGFLEAVKDNAGLERPDDAFSHLAGMLAVSHLFRVASGLESVVVGEPQILAQVRGAGIQARKQGDAKRILSPMFDRATRVGSKVRIAYGLGSGEASLSDLAVDAVEGLTHGDRAVLLIGSGKMVQLAAKRLVGSSSRLYVASRRKPPTGLRGSIPASYSEISRLAQKCDVLISATVARRPLITRGDLRGGRTKVVVDLGMPRNVSPLVRELPNVRLIDLDDLARMARSGSQGAKLEEAERAVEAEAGEFYGWLVQTRLSSTLAEIYGWADEVREGELARALGKLQPKDPREARILDVMGRRLVSKLMARPAKFARSKHRVLTDEEKLNLLRAVFGMSGESGG